MILGSSPSGGGAAAAPRHVVWLWGLISSCSRAGNQSSLADCCDREPFPPTRLGIKWLLFRATR